LQAQELLKMLEEGGDGLQQEIPEHMEKFWSFAEKVKEEGKLTPKEKSLIILAAVAIKRCEGCMVNNLQHALEAGVSREELAELCSILMLVDGGPGFASSAFLLEKFKELSND